MKSVKIYFPGWPLVMYRELATHAQQLSGVQAEIQLRSNQPFDYVLDQVDHLALELADHINHSLLAAIILHYVKNFPELETYFDLDNQKHQSLKNMAVELLADHLARVVNSV